MRPSIQQRGALLSLRPLLLLFRSLDNRLVEGRPTSRQRRQEGRMQWGRPWFQWANGGAHFFLLNRYQTDVSQLLIVDALAVCCEPYLSGPILSFGSVLLSFDW